MNTKAPKPKPRRFTTNAKVLTTTAAVATLVAGWNTIAHWDNAQADNPAAGQASSSASSSASAGTAAATAQPVLPTATATPAATLSVEALGLAPLPTLAPMTDVFTQALQAASAVAQVDLTLPAVSAPVALPTLAPLPALPSAPAQIQVPAPSVGNQSSSQAGSRGHATSGGS